MTAQPHASRPESQVMDWVGFLLWALVGAGFVVGLTSFVIFLLIPPVVGAVLLIRLSRWDGGPVLLGLVTGAGLSLVLVAGLNWSDWQHRTIGDNTPNPYYWGGVGICLVAAGMVAFAVAGRR